MLKEFVNKIYKHTVNKEEKITARGKDKIFNIIYNTHYKEIVAWFLDAPEYKNTLPVHPKIKFGHYIDVGIVDKYFKKDIRATTSGCYELEVTKKAFLMYMKLFHTNDGEIAFPKDLPLVKLLLGLPKNEKSPGRGNVQIEDIKTNWNKKGTQYESAALLMGIVLKLLFLDKYLADEQKIEGNMALAEIFDYFYRNVEVLFPDITAYSSFHTLFVTSVGWQPITSKGRIGKRTRSFIYKTLHKKASTTLIETIENTVNKHSCAKDGYYMIGKFTHRNTPWDAHEFGQSDGSCYWSGREEAFNIFYDNNHVFYFIVQYNLTDAGDVKTKTDEIIDKEGFITSKAFGELATSKYPFSKFGISRAWVIDGFGDIGANSIAIWNHYGPGTRVKYAEVLANIFNKALKTDKWHLLDEDTITYTHATYDDGTLWLNGKPAFVGTNESSKSFRADRLNVNDNGENEWEYTCENCGDGMNDAYYLDGFEGCICENCYDNHRVVCTECNEDCWSAVTKYDKETSGDYCIECYEELITNREKERKEIEESNKT